VGTNWESNRPALVRRMENLLGQFYRDCRRCCESKHFILPPAKHSSISCFYLLSSSQYITKTEASLEYQYHSRAWQQAEWIHLTFDAKTVFYTNSTRAPSPRDIATASRVINKCAYVSKYLNGAYK
jgi:hypothetical protein